MRGALLRTNAVWTRLPPLRSRARCKWLCSATRRMQCESDCSRFAILLHGARFWLRDIPLRIGAARKFHGAYFALKFRRRFAADTARSINFLRRRLVAIGALVDKF